MNEETKKLISNINSGIIPDGYKKTKVGIVPIEWEVTNLEEKAHIETGSKNTQDKVDNGKYPFFVRSQTIEHIDSYSYDCEAVITAGDGVGVGKVYHYINGKFDCHQRVYIVNKFHNALGKYIFFYVSNYFYHRVMKMNAKNSVDSVRMEMLSKMPIPFPPLPEQQKIAEILSTQDKLIELQERKIEQLKKLKKGYLQKMFPKNGSNVPELRFKGFTGDWEQQKLSEIVKSIDTGKSKFHSDSNNGEYAILGSTSIIGYDNYYDYDGDFILTARVGANAGSLYRYTGKSKISDNTVFIQAEKNIEFVYYMLTKFDIKQLSFGTGQPLVKASELKNLDLKIPILMEEQAKIGQYFTTLDNLIALNQRKLDEEKQKKKALMQLLLTGKVRVI